MKKQMICLLLLLACSPVTAQDFLFRYTSTGLGSNMFNPPPLTVKIEDSVLYWTIVEDDYNNDIPEGWFYKDTADGLNYYIYRAVFRESSRDSLLRLINDKKGQHLFNSNPNIMSGGIDHYFIRYGGNCTSFLLKNIADSCTIAMASVINVYLPPKHRMPLDNTRRNKKYRPVITPCREQKPQTYYDILKDEYELIRKQE